ncbi:MAG: hypothetical protein Q9174_000953 [Haloplaca sp. 1 TL-2023]
MADLNYFTCTLGQAVAVNERYPHPYETIIDFLEYQAKVVPDDLAVGFPIPGPHAEQAANIENGTFKTAAIQGDWTGLMTTADLLGSKAVEYPTPARSASDVAFLFHTSGTSTGLPKPIPQSHHGSIGVLPALSNGREKATFTTTPLYHGGIADCFRAWTSGAPIWLFPGKDVPITTSNVLSSLACAETAAKTIPNAAPVKYFSSVPYVLQMVASETKGMNMLRSMDIVGVGGAALPSDVGDALVREGVNLVSRFGSAECGFLLSSHRDYDRDKEWQYLRSHVLDLLTFEAQDDESKLSELIIQPQWPHMAKRNRDDGSFATADLFAPHPHLKNAWKYHSRADSQLTLITGKKFDPAPLEAAITSHSLLSDVLIFGNGTQCPGALLFRSDEAKAMEDNQLLDLIWPIVEKLNREGQAHTKLSRAMLIIMDLDSPRPEKSSKGTILRSQAEKAYEKQIQAAYQQNEEASMTGDRMSMEFVPDDDVPTIVLDIVKSVIGTNERIPGDYDLFSFGVDSVACMAIRAKLHSKIVGPQTTALPLNVVYDGGNINRLSRYLIDFRKGRMTEVEDEMSLMTDLVREHSDFETTHVDNTERKEVDVVEPSIPNGNAGAGDHVVLTGATGALGAHILHFLRSTPTVSQVTCLVRGASALAAHERVSKSLVARGKPPLGPFAPQSTAPAGTPPPSEEFPEDVKIQCIQATLSHPLLGLSPSDHRHLAEKTTMIIHAAWAVNFTARLRSFEKDHIAGLKHLLHLSLQSASSTKKTRFLFLSSTASVTGTPPSKYPIPEKISHHPEDASPLGYSRSKWVAEQICNNFHKHASSIDVRVLRIGQLTADTVKGIWNMAEAWPLMLSTAPVLHALPDVEQALDWLPVDTAAEAVLEISGATGSEPRVVEDEKGGDDCPVFHILNPHTTPTWCDLCTTIAQHSSHLGLQIMPPKEWLKRLEESEGEHPAKKLVGLWREIFGSDGPEGKGVASKEKEKKRMTFAMQETHAISRVMRDVRPLSEGEMVRMWEWVEGQSSFHKNM